MITAVLSLHKLREIALSKGIEVPEKTTKHAIVTAIQFVTLSETYPGGIPMEYILLSCIETLMSPNHIWKLSKEKVEELYSSPSFLVEEKYDGKRLLGLFVSPDLEKNPPFFSTKNISAVDLLPRNLWEIVDLPSSFRSNIRYIPDRFILDMEYLDSRKEYKVLDILYLNGEWLTEYPFHYRRSILERILQKLRHIGFPGSIPDFSRNSRREFVERVLADPEKEGVVFKSLDSPYILNSYNSSHNKWVKLRKVIPSSPSIESALNFSMEGFIYGFGPSTPGKSLEDYIGSLKIAAYLSSSEIVAISSIYLLSKELRNSMTIPGSSPPALRPEFLGKVVQFTAKPPTKRSPLFLSPRFERFRSDKSSIDCVVDSSFESFFEENGTRVEESFGE